MGKSREISQEVLRALFEYKDGDLFYRQGCGTISGKSAGTNFQGPYIRVLVLGGREYLHRLVFLYHFGHAPEIVDHIDGNPRNNRIENLREVNAAQSAWNTKVSKRNKSGSRGVHFEIATGRYRAQIMHNRKTIRLGRFENIAAATRAYEEAAKKLRNEFTRK